jgi:F-type H+-transporting ATPase subunit c
MDGVAELLHYFTVALIVSVNSIAVGLGEGLANSAALEAMNRQPKARGAISNTALLGMALIETAALIALATSIIVLFGSVGPRTIYSSVAQLGIALAICCSGAVVGFTSSLPTRTAVVAIARQPFASKVILRFMLITQSIIQTPVIFGFITAIFIKAQASTAATFSDSLRLLASGLSIGMGCIGPVIGLALFGKTACEGVGINRHSSKQIFSFTFVSEAIIETPIIFSLIISLLLLFTGQTVTNPAYGVASLAAALCIGIGTIGPGISSGRTAAAACKQIAVNPDRYPILSKISLFGQGMIDTSAIYALLISLALLLFTR